MPRRQSETFAVDGELRLRGPSAELLRSRSYCEGRSAWSGEVAAPVDDRDEPARLHSLAGGAQESDRLLGVENIEEQTRGAGAGGHAEAIGQHVALASAHIGEAGGRGALRGRGDHGGIEIERVHDTADPLRQRHCEGAVAAAEFGDVTRRRAEAEGVEGARHVEERFPIILRRHAAFAKLHAAIRAGDTAQSKEIFARGAEESVN